MDIITKSTALRDWRKSLESPKTIGFVPTMGALHEGHQTLLKKSISANDITILSIFVNPTQFNNPEDYRNYPISLREDLSMAEQLGVDKVFAPDSPSELYPNGNHVKIYEDELSQELCGVFRPGHFEGVLTVVMKLFQLVKPHRAYFGEKDYQQLELIKRMVESFFLDCEICPVPTLREASGLAMSSRNRRLNENELATAAEIYSAIKTINNIDQCKSAIESAGIKVEYLEDLELGCSNKRRFFAGFMGPVRLIDNVELNHKKSEHYK